VALNIKDLETEALAAEVAQLTGESKTGAIRAALRERRERLLEERRNGNRRLHDFLVEEVWPQLPQELIGHAPTKQEREQLLGLDAEGG
jgi:antitoxin VapB